MQGQSSPALTINLSEATIPVTLLHHHDSTSSSTKKVKQISANYENKSLGYKSFMSMGG